MRTSFLDKQFKSNAAPVCRGDNSDRVAAVQLALGRLGFVKKPVDGDFGPHTEQAVRAFQRQFGLAETGIVDALTLNKIDEEHSNRDFRSEAAEHPKPLEYLSNFAALGLDRLLPVGASPRWNDPATQAAFATFCQLYWEVMKKNVIEADCKTIALFLMDQFRKKAQLDTGNELRRPGQPGNPLPKLVWNTFTARNAGGNFSKASGRTQLRAEYKGAVVIERLMPEHSMIRGVNLSVNLVCAEVAPCAREISRRKPHNRGDHRIPEIEINDLAPGRMIFMNHDGDNDFDHAITVIAVDRKDGRVSRVVLAVGSYDDVKDSLPSTPVKSRADTNNYAEEVVIEFDEAGMVVDADADPTWASEPLYLRGKEYTAKNTIMDKNPRARMIVARWADAE